MNYSLHQESPLRKAEHCEHNWNGFLIRTKSYTAGQGAKDVEVMKGLGESGLVEESGGQAHPAAEVRLGVGTSKEVRFFVTTTSVGSYLLVDLGPLLIRGPAVGREGTLDIG
jgi:hypothetical protein